VGGVGIPPSIRDNHSAVFTLLAYAVVDVVTPANRYKVEIN
jgi:hypothetical protein